MTTSKSRPSLKGTIKEELRKEVVNDLRDMRDDFQLGQTNLVVQIEKLERRVDDMDNIVRDGARHFGDLAIRVAKVENPKSSFDDLMDLNNLIWLVAILVWVFIFIRYIKNDL
jgi:hypothetical protein